MDLPPCDVGILVEIKRAVVAIAPGRARLALRRARAGEYRAGAVRRPIDVPRRVSRNRAGRRLREERVDRGLARILADRDRPAARRRDERLREPRVRADDIRVIEVLDPPAAPEGMHLVAARMLEAEHDVAPVVVEAGAEQPRDHEFLVVALRR